MTRISADPSDPGYSAANRTKEIVVMLDGEPIKDAITADEHQGFVVVAARNLSGNLVWDMAAGKLLTSVRFGTVEIGEAPPTFASIIGRLTKDLTRGLS